MSTNEDLRARSAALQDTSRALITRALAALHRSRWRLMSSCEVLVGRRPRISGGAPDLGEGAVRQQVRALLDNGVLPTSPASEIGSRRPAAAQDDCTVCGVSIVGGEVQVEIPPPERTVVVVHRRCFDLWTQAAAERDGRS